MEATREETLGNLGKLVLRLTSGGMMLTHGIPKLLEFSVRAQSFADPLGIGHTASLTGAVTTEVLCSLAIILGAGTRLAAVPAMFTMAVAAFLVHGADPFAKKEKALLYLLMYLAVFCLGPGDWSVDGWWQRRQASES